MTRPAVGLCDEYDAPMLGDARLDRRLVTIANLMAAEPDASFPSAMVDDANLEATYRFLNNERVSPEKILAPHFRQTVARIATACRVVIAHDTTEFNFGRSGRENLGLVGRGQGQSHGFYGHFALAVDAGTRRPLGATALLVHERHGDKGRRGHSELQADRGNESARWLRGVRKVEKLVGRSCAPIHVMDREADSYSLMADLVRIKARFVVRMASQKRKIKGEHDTVAEAFVHSKLLASRDVPISTRGRSRFPSQRRQYPPRNSRMAHLEITATTVTVKRPDSSNQSPRKTLTLNAVRVFERNPPPGEEAIEWRLWTTEPIAADTEVFAIIDTYRCRWLIEEYFKALKTGCAIEKRQLETTQGLLNALAVFVPIAWRLLALRTMAHDPLGVPADDALSPTQRKCLDLALKKLKRTALPPQPTARDVMLGVAGLGGHIKSNGDPGWIVLGRGFEKLLNIELGYLLATEM